MVFTSVIIYTLRIYFNVLFIPKAWMQNKVPIPAPNEVLNDRKKTLNWKRRKTQAEIATRDGHATVHQPTAGWRCVALEGIQDDLRKWWPMVFIDLLLRRRKGALTWVRRAVIATLGS